MNVRAVGTVGVLVVVLATATTPASFAAKGTATVVTPADRAATHAYLIAQYKLSTAFLHGATAARGAESAAGAQIARECRGVLSGMPQPSLSLLAPATPRVKGENARLTHQQQTLEGELVTQLATPGSSVYRPAEEAFAAEVSHLSWSDPTIVPLLQVETAVRLEDGPTATPSFCADARAWVQSGYRALSAASREFEASREARKRSVRRETHSVITLLKPYENASDRALIRKIKAVEYKFLNSIGTLLPYLRLSRIVGFPHADTEAPKKQIVLGRGRTAAGTRFVVHSGTSGGLFGSASSCHRSASVFYTRLGEQPELLIMGGPNNPICLSSSHQRHPALFCEVGLETIQAAVPASVRSVRLVLADGRTITSRVVRVPRRDGGPTGIYAQEIRGRSSHAVSLVELNGSDEVVLALNLPRYHCVKPREQQEFPTSAVNLATGHTPEGEAFTISAFGEFNGEPSLSVDAGVDPQLNEPIVGFHAPKLFPWSLSVGCAPHPYAIVYGILAPPGKSVTARTAQGAVALNVVPVEPRLHAKGPLLYGVFSAVPSELTVLGADGSTIHSENLQAQATEAAQFCEGYAEP